MKSARFAVFAALAALALAPAAHAKLSPTESRMAETVKAEQGRSIALLERLVNQNSGTLNLAGVERWPR